MPRLLLLITHRSYRAQAFLEAAGELGAAVTVGTDREQALAFLAPASNLTLDFGDADAAVERALAFDQTYPLDAVVAAEDDGVILAARIAEALGLASNGAEAVMAARDKLRARRIWREAGLPGPRFRAFSVEDDPAHVAEMLGASAPFDRHVAAAVDPDAGIGTEPEAVEGGEAGARGGPGAALPAFPCVLKPLALSASRGVIRADDAAGFVAAWRRLAAILSRPEIAASGDRPARRILVEDYLAGFEIAVEGILEAGRLQPLAIFDKPDPLEGPFFEETIYITPSRLSDRDRSRAVEMVEGAAGALGLRHGPVHAELRIDDHGPWMLEIAPRSIGGLCGRSLRFVAEGARVERERSNAPAASNARVGGLPWISLESLILRHAIGQAIGAWRREPLASGVMMIPIPKAGILREVRGQDRARAVSGVEELRMGLAPGSPVQPPPEGAQYLGFIFARGRRPEDVERSLRAAHRALELDIDDSQGRGGPRP